MREESLTDIARRAVRCAGREGGGTSGSCVGGRELCTPDDQTLVTNQRKSYAIF